MCVCVCVCVCVFVCLFVYPCPPKIFYCPIHVHVHETKMDNTCVNPKAYSEFEELLGSLELD